MTNNETLKLIARAIEINKQLEVVKSLYGELDLITTELVKNEFVSAVHNGTCVLLVDNFKTKNTCFRTTSVKRFELKIE